MLDVQSELMDALTTRMMVPLLAIEQAPTPAKRLNPVFAIGGKSYVMLTQFMAAVTVAEVKDVRGSLAQDHFVIKSAIDMIFNGI